MENARPEYKRHALWEEAMAIARDAYALADEVRGRNPEGAFALRKAAVAAPARIAEALTAEQESERRDAATGARETLADVAARASALGSDPGAALAARARELERTLRERLAVAPAPEGVS